MMWIGPGAQFPAFVMFSPLSAGGLLDGAIFDAQAPDNPNTPSLDNTCYPQKLEDGQYHCLLGGVAASFFLDPACTSPAAGQYAAYVSNEKTQDGYTEVCAFDAPYEVLIAGALIASGAPVQTYQVLPTTGICSASSIVPVREIVGALDPTTIPALPLMQD
jgi:hypothetical protein